jgi:hypothetical protein
VRVVTKVVPDSQTTEARVQKHHTDYAGDIKKCASTRDTYSKLVRIRSALFVLIRTISIVTAGQHDRAFDQGHRFVTNPGSRHSRSCTAIVLEVGVHKNLRYSNTEVSYSLPHRLAYWEIGKGHLLLDAEPY